MGSNFSKNKRTSFWRGDVDAFSVVDFLAEGPEYFAKEPFTIHIARRSGDINEFFNLQLQIKIAHYLGYARRIRAQIRKSIPNPPAEQKTELTAGQDNRLQFKHQGKIFEIAYSPEQYAAYFDLNRDLPPEVPQATPGKKEEDVFDRFLKDPSFFKRSTAPEEIPPDESIAESVEADEDLVTETLAKIHLRQGNTDEARRIYQRLSLLFPEKSAYFEAQIKKIDLTES